jgi:ABC-type multidrug transport system fused ATPase/permease subunit
MPPAPDCILLPPRCRRTLLVIAHRVDTIMDCDSLLVLDRGRLVESGGPGELSRRPGGTFARLVAAAEAARR